jgi:hypothetical protein
MVCIMLAGSCMYLQCDIRTKPRRLHDDYFKLIHYTLYQRILTKVIRYRKKIIQIDKAKGYFDFVLRENYYLNRNDCTI